MSNNNERRPELRFGFVEMLFALTVAEIAIQLGELFTSDLVFWEAPTPYAHLSLALILVAASWVGWATSRAEGAKRDVKKIFSWEFVVLLIDVVLVVSYFILVKGVDTERAGDRLKETRLRPTKHSWCSLSSPCTCFGISSRRELWLI